MTKTHRAARQMQRTQGATWGLRAIGLAILALALYCTDCGGTFRQPQAQPAPSPSATPTPSGEWHSHAVPDFTRKGRE